MTVRVSVCTLTACYERPRLFQVSCFASVGRSPYQRTSDITLVSISTFKLKDKQCLQIFAYIDIVIPSHILFNVRYYNLTSQHDIYYIYLSLVRWRHLCCCNSLCHAIFPDQSPVGMHPRCSALSGILNLGTRSLQVCSFAACVPYYPASVFFNAVFSDDVAK